MANLDSTSDLDVIQIPLSNGTVTLISAVDYDLAHIGWYCSELGYAAGHAYLEGKRKNTALHRVIFARILGRPLTKKENIDHINTQKLDNRRENLRLATHAENRRNCGTTSKNKSGYKGVHLSNRNTWVAQIGIEHRLIHLGTFKTKEDAARAYNEAALKYFGEFAWLNIVPDSE